MTVGLADQLRSALGDRWVSTTSTDRRAYARDLWPRGILMAAAGDPAPHPPDVVCWPADEAQVAQAMLIAAERDTPIVPYGAGSGVCGGTWPVHGGLIIDVKRLRGLSLDRRTHRVRGGAGWVGQHLEDALNLSGRTLGHFPSSIRCSTLGGWVAARSAGQLSSRYGKIEDMLRGLRVALPDGRVLALSSDDVGADWMQVVTGSEGTLAVITEATLVTHPVPAVRRLSGWRLTDVASGVDAMRRLMQAGLRPAVLRLYDEFDTVLALRAHDEASRGDDRLKRWALAQALERTRWLNRMTRMLPGGCLLITGFEGEEGLADAEAAQGEAILRAAGAAPLGPEPGLRWFHRRHSVSYKQPATFGAGAWVDTMEVATTWSGVAPLYEAVRKAVGEHVFVMAHFSHAYAEGCSIYFSFAGGPVGRRAEALRRYDDAWAAALGAVAERRATISHHHGVGLSKAAAMIAEQGPGGRRLFDLAKAHFDPLRRMNPGKLWAEGDDAGPPPQPVPIGPHDLLMRCRPDERVGALERRANARGATLGPMPKVETLAEALRLPHGATRSPRYGRPLDRVVSLIARLPDGSMLRPTLAPRKAVGPDYVRMVLTAQPPVAEVQELVLRLLPLPEVRTALELACPEDTRRRALDLGVRPAIEAWREDRWSLVLEGSSRVVAAERALIERLKTAAPGAAPAPQDPGSQGP